jgi:hypothetical protein
MCVYMGQSYKICYFKFLSLKLSFSERKILKIISSTSSVSRLINIIKNIFDLPRLKMPNLVIRLNW